MGGVMVDGRLREAVVPSMIRETWPPCEMPVWQRIPIENGKLAQYMTDPKDVLDTLRGHEFGRSHNACQLNVEKFLTSIILPSKEIRVCSAGS
jgi:hypothetical protein